MTPFGREAEADAVKRSFKVENSDFLTTYNAYCSWREASANGFEREFTRVSYFLVLSRISCSLTDSNCCLYASVEELPLATKLAANRRTPSAILLLPRRCRFRPDYRLRTSPTRFDQVRQISNSIRSSSRRARCQLERSSSGHGLPRRLDVPETPRHRSSKRFDAYSRQQRSRCYPPFECQLFARSQDRLWSKHSIHRFLHCYAHEEAL